MITCLNVTVHSDAISIIRLDINVRIGYLKGRTRTPVTLTRGVIFFIYCTVTVPPKAHLDLGRGVVSVDSSEFP